MLSHSRVLNWFVIPLLAVVATVVLCEAGFRLFVEVTDVPFYFWDPLIGPRMAPNQSGRYLVGRDIEGRYRFNAQGWNHREDYITRKSPGTRRVCLIGDSYVEALHVQLNETMYAVAEREREMDHPDRHVQWYAFGVSGFGTAAEHDVVREYVLGYEPDLVILFFVQNDPFESSPYLSDLPSHRVRYLVDGEG